MTSDGQGGKGRQEAESGAPKEIKGLVRSLGPNSSFFKDDEHMNTCIVG